MIIRTRRWPAIAGALMFVVAACGGAPGPTTVPTTGTPATSPPAAASTPPGSPAESTPPPTGGETTPPGSPGETTPPPTGGETTPPVGQPGGTIILGEWQAAENLHPFFTTAFTETKASSPVLRGLFITNADGVPQADLASEVPSEENGALVPDEDGEGFTLTLKMKPDLMWSDGEPLTMNDVKFTYDYAIAQGKAGGCGGCGLVAIQIDPELTDGAFDPDNLLVDTFEISDDGLTATVTWKTNYASWLLWAPTPLPAHFFTPLLDDQAGSIAAMAVGPTLSAVPWSGPFVVVNASSEGIDYAPNPNWNAGTKSSLEGLRYRYFGSKDGMIAAFLNGEVDLIDNMTLADFPAINVVDPSVGRAENNPAWQYEHLDLNGAQEAKGLDDPRVRTAIAHTINKPDLLTVLFPGTDPADFQACSIAPPGTWWRIDVTCAEFDLAEADRLLTEAGWPLDPETGRRYKDGDVATPALRMDMCTSSGNPTRLTTLGKVNAYLAAPEIGIPSDISTADAASVYFAAWNRTTPETHCSIYRGTYDIALFTYIVSADVYGNYYYGYHSSQIPEVGANTTRTNDERMDTALDNLGLELTIEGQRPFAEEIQTLMAELNNEIPLYYRNEPHGISNHVVGFVMNPSTSSYLWNAETWTYQP